MLADKVVFAVVVAGGFYAAGLMVGEERTRDAIATQCVPQADEKLIATIQTPDGVVCQYAHGYGRAKQNRRAS